MSNFLQKSKILLISSHNSHRSGLRKTLIDLGVNNKNVEVASDYLQAKDILLKEPIQILISDEEIGKGHQASDLLELHRKNNPLREERFFIVLMDNEITPFTLADFTIRGGDMALSKPFKNDNFIKILVSMIEAKGKLSNDDKIMLTIEDLVAGGETIQATALLIKIKNKNSVQYFYSHGLIAEAEGNLEDAFNSYLKSNEIKPGFKSLVTLIRTGAKLKKYSELKSFVDVWLYDFPIHHSSISDITRVIIANKKYDLLDQLFKIFSTHNVTDTLVRTPLAAGFVMVSTDYLDQGKTDQSKEYALKGIEYSNKRLPIIFKAVENLVKAGDKEAAEKAYIKNVPELSNLDEQVLDLKIRATIYPKSKILSECMKMIEQKVIHAELFSFTILCLKEVGKDPGEIIVRAKRSFPNLEFN